MAEDIWQRRKSQSRGSCQEATLGRCEPREVAQQRYADELVDSHIKKCTEALNNGVSDLKAGLQESTAPMESTIQLCQQAQEVFERIESSCARFRNELGQLQTQFDLDHTTTDEDELEILDLDADEDPDADLAFLSDK